MLVLLCVISLMLIIVGGLASLAVVVDKHGAKKAPIPFAALFAGVGFWVALVVSAVLFSALAMKGVVSEELAFAATLLLALVGGGGGVVYGYHLGLARRRKYAHLDT